MDDPYFPSDRIVKHDGTGGSFVVNSSPRLAIGTPVLEDNADPNTSPSYYSLKIKSTKNEYATDSLIAHTFTVKYAYCPFEFIGAVTEMTKQFSLGSINHEAEKYRFYEFLFDTTGCNSNDIDIRDTLPAWLTYDKVSGHR